MYDECLCEMDFYVHLSSLLVASETVAGRVVVVPLFLFWNKFLLFPTEKFFAFLLFASSAEVEESVAAVLELLLFVEGAAVLVVVVPRVLDANPFVFLVGIRTLGFVVGGAGVSVDLGLGVVVVGFWVVNVVLCSTMDWSLGSSSLSYSSEASSY